MQIQIVPIVNVNFIQFNLHYKKKKQLKILSLHS